MNIPNRILLVTTERSTHASRLEEELNLVGADYSRLNTDCSIISNLPQHKITENSTESNIVDSSGKGTL